MSSGADPIIIIDLEDENDDSKELESPLSPDAPDTDNNVLQIESSSSGSKNDTNESSISVVNQQCESSCQLPEKCPLFKKVAEKIDEQDKCIKILQAQLLNQTCENNKLKSLLLKKDKIIQTLTKEFEKRESIFDMCYKTEMDEVTGKEGDCLPEIFLSSSPGGHRVCEIRKKQQVPFTIKTEILSPRIWERLNDETDSYLYENDSKITENPEINNNNSPWEEEEEKDIKSKEAQNFIATKIDTIVHELYSKSPEPTMSEKKEMPPSSSSTSPYSEAPLLSKSEEKKKKRSHSNSSSKNRRHTAHHKATKKDKHHRRDSHDKSRKRESESSTKSDEVPKKKRKLDSTKDTNKQRDETKPSFFSLGTVENVLKISKLFRPNFGTSNEWEISECPIGKKFWYDEKHSKMTKYFIRLHDDSGDWENLAKFTVLEQIGLCVPQTYALTFSEILEKLEKNPKKRIWVDLRDFDIFSPSNRPLLASFEDSISHFSFGHRLYSMDFLRSNLLLEYIFLHLKNLEFLSINNGMLSNLSTSSEPKVDANVTLSKLKTLRFVLSKPELPLRFMMKILERVPKVEKVYGIPLYSIRETERDSKSIIKLNNLVRSITIRGGWYDTNGETLARFKRDLSSLYKVQTLEELDTRTCFILNPHKRNVCRKQISRVILRNQKYLRKLVLEPTGSCDFLDIPVLKNVKTLQLNMNLRARVVESPHKASTFFPLNFDLHKKFPSLNSIEIYLDRASGLNFSEQRNPLFHVPVTPLHYFEQNFPRVFMESKGVVKAFEHIKSLKLQRFCPHECMPRIQELFPNLRILRLSNNLVDVSFVLPLCFEFWPKLQQLILEVNVDTQFGNLDPAMIGLSPCDCNELRNMEIFQSLTDEGNLRKIEKWMKSRRNRLPIFMLPELHLFKIVLRAAPITAPLNMIPVLTPISALFGFEKSRMPQLTIQIGFDERLTSAEIDDIVSSLTPVLPFVTLER